MDDIYRSFAKYSSAMRRKDSNSSEKLLWFYSKLHSFLSRFDWILSYTATDIAEQEKRGDKRFTGVCYDACKYLAQKFEQEGIAYRAYWICGIDKKSIRLWFSGQSLHSFNVCTIDNTYYFADCFFAPILTRDDCIFGFSNEKDALAWAGKAIVPNSPFVLREFNPLSVNMGNHIVYSLI
jgi:hypothetical protein